MTASKLYLPLLNGLPLKATINESAEEADLVAPEPTAASRAISQYHTQVLTSRPGISWAVY
ncbi:MAG: hypothetical protein IT308_10775 [Anaerolineaceae bacterium]|nr:hypothetical protein [Anaerolineaceae bacterium]